MSSKIEYVTDSWSPVTGCSHISAGCYHCYAARLAGGRLRNHFHYRGLVEDGRWTGEVRVHSTEYDRPREWRKPRMVFVCSMSDLFHERVPDRVIDRDIFPVMKDCKHHTFLILTKRPERMVNLWGSIHPWPENIWLGVSVETPLYKWRLDHLVSHHAKIKFASLEPILQEIELGIYLNYLSWVIVGGESGSGARQVNLAWIRNLRNECRIAGIPFFLKQIGTYWAHDTFKHDVRYRSGANSIYQLGDHKGSKMEYWPEDLRIREYPEL